MKFIENIAYFLGGAIAVMESELIMLGEALFYSNFAIYGGSALRGFVSKRILCKSNGKMFIFQRNRVHSFGHGARGGAIFTTLSHLELEGIVFKGNFVRNGGAVSSKDYVLLISTCNFYNNTAVIDGSALSFLVLT